MARSGGAGKGAGGSKPGGARKPGATATAASAPGEKPGEPSKPSKPSKTGKPGKPSKPSSPARTAAAGRGKAKGADDLAAAPDLTTDDATPSASGADAPGEPGMDRDDLGDGEDLDGDDPEGEGEGDGDGDDEGGGTARAVARAAARSVPVSGDAEAEATRARYHPQRAIGDPSVAFAVNGKAAPWRVALGAFELALPVRSAGGSGRGVRVRVSGDALRRVAFERVRAAGGEAAFALAPDGSAVAELGEVELRIGLLYPLDPKPKNDAQKVAAALLLGECEFELVLVGVARVAGADLLALEVGALGSPSPPLKWMRPLAVV